MDLFVPSALAGHHPNLPLVSSTRANLERPIKKATQGRLFYAFAAINSSLQ
jgi:hypothetical protein